MKKSVAGVAYIVRYIGEKERAHMHIFGVCAAMNEGLAAYSESDGWSVSAAGLAALQNARTAASARSKATNANRRSRDAVARDLGLSKVRGAVSGRTYYE